MSAVAAVVLAHNDAPKVRRLTRALRDTDIFLHCDARTPAGVLGEMLAGAGPRVLPVPRRRTSLDSWSLVDAELRGLELALERSDAEHIAVMSGSCYPLLSGEALADELAAFRGRSRLLMRELPHRPWDTPRNRDGGMWRFRRRFVTFRGQIVRIGDIPLRTLRRVIPPGLELRASSQWKIYARDHAARLLAVLDARPELRRFWRSTLVPDEACAASLLASPEISRIAPEELHNDCPWYMRWPAVAAAGHPDWLGPGDLPALRAARADHILFARKLGSPAAPTLDQIDEELRR